ncbi:chorismate--pyruvate lyase family protein [Thalassotalea fusca]
MITQHAIYPVGLNANWRDPAAEKLDNNLRDWLLDRQSLTKRLIASSERFRVQVLGQQVTTCAPHEANEDILVGEAVIAREVLLFCDEVPHVFARSLLPLRSLTGNQSELSRLGNESLGQVLFNHPDLKRKCIEVADFDVNTHLSSILKHFDLKAAQALWGRRSVFMIEQKPLMVAEVFLPNALAYEQVKVC